MTPQPAQTIDGVIAAMHAIGARCEPDDGLRWFNQLYLEVTQAVGARVQAGGFHDLNWLTVLDLQFAGLYFSALQTAESRGRAPGCWRALFDRRMQPRTAAIQFALAGVNAHINHDLPMAIVATCHATGTMPTHSSPQYADYTAVNSTLDSMIEAAKRELGIPPFSHVEDMVAAFSVSAAREAAWNQAEVLWTLRSYPPVRDRMLDTLDGLTALAGKALLVPLPPPALP